MSTQSAQHESPSEKPRVEELVDEALCRLSDADRNAVTLRYLQGKSQREVAEALGVSEDAAAQRLSRAVAKLRKYFAGRGTVLSAATLEQTLSHDLYLAAPQTPAHLAQAAADAALSPAATTAASAAAAIATAVLSLARWKAAGAVGAALAILFVLCGGIAMAYLDRDDAPVTATTAPAALPLAPPQSNVIRVGVYVSAATAVPRPARNNAWYKMFVIADDLKHETGMELVPLIEPGSSQHPQQKRLMGVYFPDKAPIDVMDTAALRSLDVIVASAVHNPPQKALDSIDAAVRGGTGLFVRRCLGNHPPLGNTPVAARLRGLATHEQDVIAATGPLEWVVVSGHPILGDLTPTSLKRPIIRSTAGQWGTLPPDALPLIRLRHVDALTPGGANTTTRPVLTTKDTTGDVLYLSHLGKGRVISANFFAETPPEIQEATDNRFTALSVKWLAGQPVE